MNGKDIIDNYNGQPTGKVDGFVTLERMIDDALADAMTQAFMAGQINCGVDPSYSSSRLYALEFLSKAGGE